MTHRESEDWRRAESFRKAEIYGRAAKYFRACSDDTGDPEAGWRYAHCLRRTGYHELALGVLTDLNANYPDHAVIREELIWSLYEGRLIPAKEKGDGTAVIAAAREMVDAEAEGTALRLAVFAVVGAAKTKGHWKLVSSWCDLLEPDQLSSVAKTFQNGSIPSDRERWYFAKVKALVNLQEWHLAVGAAEAALADFSSNPNFIRWKANSLAGLGRQAEALELLETLRPAIAWYALADMARYSLELEDVEGAWLLAQEAAHAVGQDSAKVNLWELMAKTALALAMPDAALSHIGLMEAIRRERSWPIRFTHQQLIDRIAGENDITRLPNRSVRDWKAGCKTHWGAKPSSSPSLGVRPQSGVTNTGKVVGWEADRSFAFIAPKGGGEQIFVRTQDLPESARCNGAWVSYATIKHFDKRRQRDSLRAVELTVASK